MTTDTHHASGRGRQAEAPQEVTAPGWKDILLRTYREFGDDRVTLIAAAVTYYLLLALVPTLTAFVSIYGLFTDPATASEHVRLLSGVVPEGGLSIIDEQLSRLTGAGGTTLSIALLVSVAIALWSASSGVKTMFEAMNVAYGKREERNFFVLNATALLFTLAGIAGAILMIGAVVLVPLLLDLVGLGRGMEWALGVGTYLLLVAALMLGLAALYRFGPNHPQAKWRWVSPGALLATVTIIIVSLIFSWYAANFGNYDKTYGSLGGLIALLTWMWITVTAIIMGAELNSEAERPAEKDDGGDGGDGQIPDGNAESRTGDIGKHGPQWQAGYNAAKERYQPERRHSIGAMVVALPFAVALAALRSSRKR